jgi:hypothetical protein
MRCPKCDFEQSDQNTECLKCGIIFEKYYEHPTPILRKRTAAPKEKDAAAEGETFFKRFVFFVEPEVNPFYWGGRVIIFLVIFIWGWKFILTPMTSNYAGNSFLHFVNLPFHEAGHIFFRLFGRWMTSLGGTLGQLLIPILCLLTFLIKYKNPFGASVALWWLAESMMDVAPYIDDARNGQLMLLGEVTGREADYGYHDWEFILNEIGLLRYDHTLARIGHDWGVLLMLISFAWAGWLLFKQYRNLDLTQGLQKE